MEVRVGHKIVLTPQQLHRALGLPKEVAIREVSLSQGPPGIHVKLGAALPDGWTLPSEVRDCPGWSPTTPAVDIIASITTPTTCAHGDHEWPPPGDDGPWITGDGVWHRWDAAASAWVHDEGVEVGAVLDAATGGPI